MHFSYHFRVLLLAIITSTYIIHPIQAPIDEYIINPKGIVFVDLDDTISRGDHMSVAELIYLAKKAAPCCNSMYDATRLLFNIRTVIDKGHNLAKQPNATTETVILDIIDYLKQKNYGDFSPIIESITKVSANKKPIAPMIAYLKQLKEQGYLLIATTNQDAWGHTYYREKLKTNYALDLDQLFQATLCCYSTLIPQYQKEACPVNNCFMINRQHHIYMTNNVTMRKPYENYFVAALDIAKQYCSGYTPTTPIMLIDDVKQNIDGFNQFIKDQKLHGEGIYFPRPKYRENQHLKSDKNFINEIIKPIIQSFETEKAT